MKVEKRLEEGSLKEIEDPEVAQALLQPSSTPQTRPSLASHQISEKNGRMFPEPINTKPDSPRKAWRRYLAAVLLVVGVTTVRLAFLQPMGTHNPYVIFFPAVILAAFYGGLGPGLLATGLAALLANYFWIKPVDALEITDLADWLGFALFIAGGTMTSWVAEVAFRAQARARVAERRLTEESQLQLAAIVHSSDDAIIGKTLDGNITSWNPGAEKIFGYSAAEAIGKSMLMLFPPERADEEKEILARIARGECVEHFETIRVRKDGKHIHVSATVSAIKDRAGKIIGASKIARDITEHKQAEESLKLFRLLIDRSSDGIEVIDPETGRFLDINDETCRELGYSREEFLSLTVPDIDPRFVTLAVWKQQIEDIRQKGFKIFESKHRRKDGSLFPVEINVRYVKMERDYIIASVRDITERKRAEEELRKLSRAVEQSPASIIITNMAGNIEYVNRKFTEATGYSPEEVLGKNPRFLKSGEMPREAYKQLWENIMSGKEWRGEFHNRKKNGDLFWEQACISAITDAGGRVTHFLAVKEDITGKRKLEEQLLQSQKMQAIGQLAGGVAHDFNNILTVIQVHADLMKTDVNPSPSQLEAANDISLAVQRATALTRQLLTFSRKQTLRRQDLDLNQSINDMTKILRRSLGEDIQLQYKFAMQPLFIHADAGMLDQVLMNLAVNARDAMPQGGQLVIETSAAEFDESNASQSAKIRPGSFVCLSVGDSGCGIAPENLHRIFEPFFTTKAVGQGTGLGLATVFGIVQQHQGWINVYSEVGKGTNFRIYLPRLEKLSQKKSTDIPLTTLPGGNETILLVEDDALLCASVSKTLSRLGYQVFEAINGFEALEIWKQHRGEIHLLLTDMVMPGGITGVDLGERFLKDNPKLKVIYASGYSAEVAGKDFSLEEGVNFITKPFQAAKLAQTVRARLDA